MIAGVAAGLLDLKLFASVVCCSSMSINGYESGSNLFLAAAL